MPFLLLGKLFQLHKTGCIVKYFKRKMHYSKVKQFKEKFLFMIMIYLSLMSIFFTISIQVSKNHLMVPSFSGNVVHYIFL